MNIWAIIIVSLFIFIGLLGTLLPVLPGIVILWAGIFIYKLWVPTGITWNLVIFTGVLAVIGIVLDYVSSYLGARKFGATWRGGIGALIGGILGPFVLGALITPIGGLIVGPVIGAVAGELISGRNLKESGKAGFGTIVGGIVAALLKLVIAIFMAGWFYIEVFGH